MDKEQEHVYPTRLPPLQVMIQRYLKYEVYHDETSVPEEPGSFIYSPLPTDNDQEFSEDMHRVLQDIKNDLEPATMRESVISRKADIYSDIRRILNTFVILTLAFHASCKTLRIAILKRTGAQEEMKKFEKSIANIHFELPVVSTKILEDARALKSRAADPVSSFERITSEIVTRKIGQKLAYAGAVIGFIVSMMQLVAGKRLEAVVVILSFFAGLFTLGSALKYICRNALAYTPSNLRSTEDSMNRVNVSVHLGVTKAMLGSEVIVSTIRPPLSTEVEQERRWFARQMAYQLAQA
ncbi:hypothetical protein CPB86DRAFT_824305 [Serendipita vermifera]|nr:hypothetical protein CPB86DRAFT_824305 [Serendipita vermifera]